MGSQLDLGLPAVSSSSDGSSTSITSALVRARAWTRRSRNGVVCFLWWRLKQRGRIRVWPRWWSRARLRRWTCRLRQLWRSRPRVRDGCRRPGSDVRRRVLPPRQLPAPVPKKPLPSQMHGRCYNCGEEDHIRADCTNNSRCFLCGSEEHHSNACKRPRSPSDGAVEAGRGPVRQRLGNADGVGDYAGGAPVAGGRGPMRQRLGPSNGEGGSPPLPPPPPLAGLVAPPVCSGGGPAVRSWAQIAQAPGLPRLSVPFAARDRGNVLVEEPTPVQSSWPGKLCIVDPSREMERLESELSMALLGSLGGSGPKLCVSEAGDIIRAHFRLSHSDISLVAYHPEDYLLLFRNEAARSTVLNAGGLQTDRMLLFVKPWSCQEGAFSRTMFSKVEVQMVGIPGHAWEMRSADVLLQDSCWIDEVAFATVSRSDMSCFRFSAWTPDPTRIPSVNTLAVTEPDDGLRLCPPVRGRRFRTKVKTLLYPVQISWQVSEPSPAPSPGLTVEGTAGTLDTMAGRELGMSATVSLVLCPRLLLRSEAVTMVPIAVRSLGVMVEEGRAVACRLGWLTDRKPLSLLGHWCPLW
ncbi:hypothetical protein ACQ4PT_055620 [Festuca glaucescens]